MEEIDKMNMVQKSVRKMIKFSFNAAVWVIDYCSKMDVYHLKVDELRALDNGTLGREIAQCLDAHQLTLVPKYESHDLKHVLLGYEMTSEDEIRMQAFMVGNGNYSIPSLSILGFGAILLPEMWSTFAKDFRRGRRTQPISHWTIEKYKHRNLVELQTELTELNKIQKSLFSMERLIKYGAFTSIIAGVFGMIFCLPFLFSNNLADLVGAGFPFVGGAILAAGGLMVLAKSQQVASVDKAK